MPEPRSVGAAVDAASPGLERARRQLASEIAHWRAAAHAVGDLDTVAAPAAWAALERYLDVRIRQPLSGIARTLAAEGDQLASAVAGARTADELTQVRRNLLRFRRRYLRAETVIDFYCEAVNTRTTPKLASLLRGLDTIASDSMAVVLSAFGVDTPPVLTYLDKGLGASILRAGVRLWDSGALSPAAAIKITRHNLFRPSSLMHECGHQVAHLRGWNRELGDALHDALRPRSTVAEAWRGWASEVAADVYAFCLLGYAPVPALANVVDGTTDEVFTMLFGDPHPFAWIRVMFNVELCRLWYGAGPWDDLRAAWVARHPIHLAAPGARHVLEGSLPHLQLVAEVCTRRPMQAFGGQPLSRFADPRRASASELAALAQRAGSSLYTSSFLARHESLRVLAWNTFQAAVSPDRAPELARQLAAWLQTLGAEPSAAAA
jgi:hypothetical protein